MWQIFKSPTATAERIMMVLPLLPLTTDAETLQALAILAVAIGIAGVAVLILFAKGKI